MLAKASYTFFLRVHFFLPCAKILIFILLTASGTPNPDAYIINTLKVIDL